MSGKVYDLYIKQHVREMIFKKDVTYEEAYTFLDSKPFSLVKRGNEKYFSKEELENAKSIRQNFGTGFSSGTISGESVSEDSDSELSGPSGDNSE